MIIDGYIRVSRVADREGERFISPIVQREQIEGWARLHGHRVGELFEELDESGARADRPLLMQAIARQESGDAQILCVAKLDRFGRSLVDGLTAIERITRSGGNVVSVADGLDFDTDTGRLVLRLMLSLAEWELDRVRTVWASAQEQAINRGVHMGSIPLGYRRRRDGRLVIDPEVAPLVRDLFRRRSEGEGATGLARDLTARGIPTYLGASCWAPGTVRGMLRRRVYLGEVRHGRFVNSQAHQPLVDAATWQAAQAPVGGGARARRAEPALLHGLLRCGGCGRLLTTKTEARGTPRERVVYHCLNRSSAGQCPAPVAIADGRVEPYVEAVMWAQMGDGASRSVQARLSRAEKHARQRGQELAAYRDSPRLLATLGSERFTAGLSVRVEREERALLELAQARSAVAAVGPGVQELRSGWPRLTLKEKRKAIAATIDTVFVSPGRNRGERIWVMASGSAPADLVPAAPRAMPPPRPFSPSPDQPRAKPARGSLDWTPGRTRRVVTPFLADRGEWPRFSEFQAAGLGLAHANLQRLGAMHKWAEEFGLAYPIPRRAMVGWSEGRVRRELSQALEGRDRWPTADEFRAMGLGQLRLAASAFGSPEGWAREIGVTFSLHQRRCCARWTAERIEATLRALCAGSERWPTKPEFESAGLLGLYEAIARAGTRQHLAAKLGLAPPPEQGYYRGPNRWTERAIESALAAFLAGHTVWPTQPMFAAAGLGGLYQAIAKSHGGHDRQAERYGLPRIRRPSAKTGGAPAITAS